MAVDFEQINKADPINIPITLSFLQSRVSKGSPQ
jgi:hypothetical protein